MTVAAHLFPTRGLLTPQGRSSCPYRNGFCNPPAWSQQWLNCPLETLSHLYVSWAVGGLISAIRFSFSLHQNLQSVTPRARRNALLTRLWALLGLPVTQTCQESHSSWASNEAHRNKRKCTKAENDNSQHISVEWQHYRNPQSPLQRSCQRKRWLLIKSGPSRSDFTHP